MPTLNQSLVLPLFRPESDLGGFLDEVKAIGFAAVEFWTIDADFEEVVEEVHRRGLRVASMIGHESTSPTHGSHCEGFSRRRNHERIEAELRETIDLAATHNIPGLITLSGHRNPEESDYASMCVCAEGIRRIVPYAEEKGVNLNIELLNTTIDHPHYLCDNTDWAIALCEMVNSPRCRILYDIYHMQIMEGDLCRSIQRAAKWIGHYHTAGVPGRHELDDEQEIHYRGVAKTIASTGYDLYIGHEFMAKGDKLAALRQAYEAMNVPVHP